MHTERGFDRLVNFSDATIAIAMTLLVLPLVDLGEEARGEGSLWHLLSDNSEEFFGFLLGFAVIWFMWMNHHRIMEYFKDYDRPVFFLHLLWLVTMVLMPFTTQLITNDDFYRHGAVAVYVAVLLVSSLALHLLGTYGRRHRALLEDDPQVEEWLAEPFVWTTVVLMAVILVVVILFPDLGAWPLVLLFFDGLITRAFVGRRPFAS